MWFRQMAQLSTTMSKILIRGPNGSQSKERNTPRPERDCIPLKVSLGSFDATPRRCLLTFLTSNRFLSVSFSFPALVVLGALSTSMASMMKQA